MLLEDLCTFSGPQIVQGHLPCSTFLLASCQPKCLTCTILVWYAKLTETDRTELPINLIQFGVFRNSAQLVLSGLCLIQVGNSFDAAGARHVVGGGGGDSLRAFSKQRPMRTDLQVWPLKLQLGCHRLKRWTSRRLTALQPFCAASHFLLDCCICLGHSPLAANLCEQFRRCMSK